MIIEYRYTDYSATPKPCPRVLVTYRDVNTIECKGSTAVLFGLTPAVTDERGQCQLITYAQSYLIAIIHLAPGEYLERVTEDF
jgi:hypothetical protein